MRSMQSIFRSSNFTLLELLVIVAVILTFMVMLPEAVRCAAEAKEQADCRQNIKQIGAATQAYAADANSWLPYPGLEWYTKKKIGEKLDAWIDPSVPSKNVQKFLCEEDKTPLDKRQDSANKLWVKLADNKVGWVPLSYGINLIVTGDPKHPYFTPHQLNQMEDPKACFIVCDAAARDVSSLTNIVFRHRQKANIVFADGHVGIIEKSSVPPFKSNLEQAFWVGGTE